MAAYSENPIAKVQTGALMINVVYTASMRIIVYLSAHPILDVFELGHSLPLRTNRHYEIHLVEIKMITGRLALPLFGGIRLYVP